MDISLAGKIINTSESSLKIVTRDGRLAAHFKKVLKANGYGLDWCRSYSSCSRKLGRVPVKAIFLDADVVREFGKGLFKEIRTLSSKTAIVLIHGESDHDLVREGMHLGVYGCIRAPYEDWEILKMAAFLATRP